MSAMYPSVLVTIALDIESQGLFEKQGVPVLFTGIGKVNAAHALTKRLAEYRAESLSLPLVINFGTAGSQRHQRGAVIACTRFVQRDMDVSGLGFKVGVTPFESAPTQLEFPETFDNLPQGTCGSGDSFETRGIAHNCDVIDMEAYALAKVCWFENARFACAKYVTDGADHSAADDWQSNLQHAAKAFLALYQSIQE
jgi:adenosylhomocysteine nucleosidase